MFFASILNILFAPIQDVGRDLFFAVGFIIVPLHTKLNLSAKD
jgi:hypothetical protein